MARTNKKSRAKGLPPRLALQQRGSRTGSLPSISRIVSDNRTGNFKVFFDDLATVPFHTGSSEDFIFGASVPNELLSSPYYQEFGQDFSSSLSGSGRAVKGVVDTQLAHTPGQAWMPYEEHQEPAAAATSLREVPVPELDKTNFSTMLPWLEATAHNKKVKFYATGSATEEFGADLDEPLWAKTKLEFDLTPSEEHSFGIFGDNGDSYFDNQNYPMAYWNKSTKMYEGIGPGYNFGSRYSDLFASTLVSLGTDGAEGLLNEQPIGFGKSMDRGGFPDQISIIDHTAYMPHQFARPVTDFRFPFHEKFHGTSSNLIPMCDYIDRPFLLEKAVLLVSCACDMNKTIGYRDINSETEDQVGSYMNIATFFILNQRSPTANKTIHDNADTFVFQDDIADMTPFASRYPISTFGRHHDVTGSFGTRDLITYMQIACLNKGEVGDDATPLTSEQLFEYANEAMIEREASASFDTSLLPGQVLWKDNFTLAAPVKSLYECSNNIMHLLAGFREPGLVSMARQTLRTRVRTSGRNGYRVSNGRNYGHIAGDPGVSGSYEDPYSNPTVGPTGSQSLPISHSKDNPYLLLPTDNLIFGWQVPLDIGLNSFAPGVLNTFETPRPIYGIDDTPYSFSSEGKGPELIFPVFSSKLILYGSMLGEGKEKHDTLNQLLTSEGVHEAIEGADSPPASCEREDVVIVPEPELP